MHLTFIGIKEDPTCPECGKEEMALHFLAECPMYALARWDNLENDVIGEDSLQEIRIRNMLRYAKATGRLREVSLLEHT